VAGGWNYVIFKVSSNPNHSMILRFYDSMLQIVENSLFLIGCTIIVTETPYFHSMTASQPNTEVF